MLIKPKRLRPGDRVGIVAPASPPLDPKHIDIAIGVVERLGLRAKVAANLHKRHGFLAGSDRERAGDLMRMFADSKVSAIFCLRGGYGSARLLPYLDYSVVRAHPKIFTGYSDITSLHCAFSKQADLVTFHGPMLCSDLIKEDLPEFTLNSFVRTLTLSSPPGSIGQGYKTRSVRTLSPGVVSGRLVGGNLSILCASLGTPYQPLFRNKILFLEEVDEAPYRVDRLLTQLLNARVLQQVAGIAIGLVRDCLDPKAKRAAEFRQTVEDVFNDRLKPLKIPVVLGLPLGHNPYNATVPVGVTARLDAGTGDLIITEPAVI